MTRARPVLLALDLSLRGAGMLAIPFRWGGDWSWIQRHTIGIPLSKNATPAEQILRLAAIVDAVCDFAATTGCTRGVVEEYAFSRKQSRAHALGELGGVVKLALRQRRGISLEPVNMGTARKTFLGGLPKEDAKTLTRAGLTRAGMPAEWTEHEGDAFVVGNHWLAGGRGFALVTLPKLAPRPKKKRARK